MPRDIGNIERTRRDAPTTVVDVPLEAGQPDDEYIPTYVSVYVTFINTAQATCYVRLVGDSNYKRITIPPGGLHMVPMAIAGYKDGGTGTFLSIQHYAISDKVYDEARVGRVFGRQFGRVFG